MPNQDWSDEYPDDTDPSLSTRHGGMTELPHEPSPEWYAGTVAPEDPEGDETEDTDSEELTVLIPQRRKPWRNRYVLASIGIVIILIGVPAAFFVNSLIHDNRERVMGRFSDSEVDTRNSSIESALEKAIVTSYNRTVNDDRPAAVGAFCLERAETQYKCRIIRSDNSQRIVIVDDKDVGYTWRVVNFL